MHHEHEAVIERFKRYYADYRAAGDPDSSFASAYEALIYSVLDEVGQLAEEGRLEPIRGRIRELNEIRMSIGGSNDSVKERFEAELRERAAAVR